MNGNFDWRAMKDEACLKRQQHLQRQRDVITYRIKKLAAKQMEITKKSDALKEKIRKKYEDMKRVLDQDLQITLTQLDTEHKATEKLLEEKIEECYHLTQELDQELAEVKTQETDVKVNTKNIIRIQLSLLTDPDLIQTDDFKNDQLLSITINLLLFIRSQVPVTKKLFQSYASDIVLDADTAHPKLIISPKGDSATYTDNWQDVPDTASRFDNTLNVVSQKSFSEGRHYWEVEVSEKTYWELGVTYPSIPRKGREEDCWLGRGKDSWGVEYFNGDYTAWHGGIQHVLPLLAGRKFIRIGVFCSFPGGLMCFLGADTMTPLHCFCAGTFSDSLHLALCPGHDNEGTNRKSLKICDASRSAPVL
ncbi:LOW QUALITY PROTEIN: zinc-binding protein A33 [Xenentodon cancila]